ncbi:MAG: NADH-quinone oxidoreductase subunit M [Bacteroidia bacterium]
MSESLLLLLLPLASMFLTIFFSGEKSMVSRGSMAISLIPLLYTIWALIHFNPEGGVQYSFNYAWIPSLGINLHIGLDGLSMLMILLTNFLVPLIILASVNRSIPNPNAFYSLLFLMQFALIGVFLSLDAFVFYIFWELALIPIYFICLLWGGESRVRITLKFFIYTLSGSLFMLIGIIYLYLQTPGVHTFDINAFYQLNLSSQEQSWLFWAFFLAFAIKIPIFPFHTWQPDTYTDAPTAGTMMLGGIMLKMGIYGIIRWMIPVIPQGILEWQNVAITLCVIGIVYASCIALVQKDYKRLIAYSSIAHVGLISAGVFTMNIIGLQGATIQMLAHGVNVVGLFLVADILFAKTNTRMLNELGGIANSQRIFTILFVIIMLGSVALPLTNGFVGEFLLLNSIFNYNAIMAAFAGLTVILGAVYMLRSYQSIMLGNETEASKRFLPLLYNEQIVLVVVAIVIIVTGVYPQPLLKIAEPSLRAILEMAK